MQHNRELKRMLTIDDVARLLKVSKRTVWRLVENDQIISPLKIGAAKRWNPRDLDRWIESGCTSQEEQRK